MYSRGVNMYFTNNAIAPYKRKRRSDKSIHRHNDGIKDFFVKIKQKAHELITYFKQLPNSKKIVLVLSQILKLVSILYAKRVSKNSEFELRGPRYEKEIDERRIKENNESIKRYIEKISKLKKDLEILFKERDSMDWSKGGKIWRTAMNNVARPKLESLVREQEFVNQSQNNIIEALNGKNEAERKIRSIETKTSIKIFISLLNVFLSSIIDYFTLRRPKSEQPNRLDSAFKRRIDKAVRKYVRLALNDAGVQGMKKGQHIKARDPEYVASLKGGGVAQGSPASNGQQRGMSTGKKVALGLGAAGALLGAGLIGKRLGMRQGAKKMAKFASQKMNEMKTANNQRVYNAIKNTINRP